MAVSSFPYGANTGPTIVAPTVSLVSTSVSHTSDFTQYAQVEYNSSGAEASNSAGAQNYNTSRGNWLDTGDAANAWFSFQLNSGSSLFSTNITLETSSRVSGSTSRNVRQRDINSASGGVTSNITVFVHDAATGGNQIGSATYSLTATYFNFCPLCCFTPDTLISMARGIQVPIASVRVGDTILTANGSEEVTEVITRTNRPMVRITFSDGRFVDASEDHPFDVKGEPKSLNHFGVEYKDLGLPAQLRIGDQVTTDVGTVTIRKIERLEYPDTVYTFANSKFYANGMLVY